MRIDRPAAFPFALPRMTVVRVIVSRTLWGHGGRDSLHLYIIPCIVRYLQSPVFTAIFEEKWISFQGIVL